MKYQTMELSVEEIIFGIEKQNIGLNPDFQRGEVWNSRKRKKLVDSILRGWWIPPLHFVKRNDSFYEVLDGHQRLVAIRDFCNNSFPIDGTILPQNNDLVKLNGLFYNELPAHYQKKFREYRFQVIGLIEFTNEEPAELFYRLNQPSSLTASEQTNACIGAARDQIKGLANLFEIHGVTEELIGISNSRLSYDEVLCKFCFAIEAQSIRKKITATDISNHYRNRSLFSNECIYVAQTTTNKFLTAIKKLKNDKEAKFTLNKASLYSFLVFTRQNLELGNDVLLKILLNFEFCRTVANGKIWIYKEECIDVYKRMKDRLSLFESLLLVFNRCSNKGNVNITDILYRDVVVNLFRDAFLDTKSSLLEAYNNKCINEENVINVLNDIIEAYNWGENYK